MGKGYLLAIKNLRANLNQNQQATMEISKGVRTPVSMISYWVSEILNLRIDRVVDCRRPTSKFFMNVSQHYLKDI